MARSYQRKDREERNEVQDVLEAYVREGARQMLAVATSKVRTAVEETLQAATQQDIRSLSEAAGRTDTACKHAGW